MHIVDDSEVNRVLSFPVLIEAIEAAHRRPKIAVHDSYLGDDKGQQLVTRSAVDAGRFMMTKLYTSFPGNLAHGKLPAVQAVCVLFDGNDGRPLAVMDAAEITHWKTAADSALGAKHLARPDVETLLVVGAGEMAHWLVRGHRTVRPSLKRVRIWNRTIARAEELAAPTLILHGTHDDSVPIRLSQALRDARPGLVSLETFEAGHTLSWNSDPDRWQSAVIVWLAAHVPS